MNVGLSTVLLVVLGFVALVAGLAYLLVKVVAPFRCPFCRKRVAKRATACPHCTRSLAPS